VSKTDERDASRQKSQRRPPFFAIIFSYMTNRSNIHMRFASIKVHRKTPTKSEGQQIFVIAAGMMNDSGGWEKHSLRTTLADCRGGHSRKHDARRKKGIGT
jgi:hypothetical protein